MVTSHEGDEYVIPMAQAGASSYILKDTTPKELVTAVRRAAAGESTISPRVAKALVNITKVEKRFHQDLTEREMEVLHHTAAARSNISIAKQLNISEKTVKSHVSNILSKLYLDDRTQAAVYAWREGIVTE